MSDRPTSRRAQRHKLQTTWEMEGEELDTDGDTVRLSRYGTGEI